MPTLYWRGTTDGDITDKANYVTSAGVTPASNPDNGDTLIFDWGSVDVTAVASGLTGITMIGTQEYSGRIAPGGVLGIGLTALLWLDAGEINIDGAITVGKVRCRSGSFGYTGGTAGLLYIEKTDYSIGGGAVVTALKGFNSNGTDENNATGYTSMILEGGSHTTRREATANLNNGARLTVKGLGTVTGATVVGDRSKLYYASAVTIGGSESVDVRPYGEFNAAASPGFTYSGELMKWPGANINLNTASGLVVPATVTEVGLSSDIGGPVPIG